jgi:hypothetical protein
MNNQSRRRWRTTLDWIRQLAARITPHVKAAFVISATAGPWTFAISGAGSLGLLVIGLIVSYYYTRLFSWVSGAVFGSISVIYLGPVMTMITPVVTTITTFLAVIAGSGVFFGMLFVFGQELVGLDEDSLSVVFYGHVRASKLIRGLQFFVIPGAVLSSLIKSTPQIPQNVAIFLLSFVPFYVGGYIGAWVIINMRLNLRPAILFYRELKPLLRAMRAGLLSFAVGYSFTIFLFAGFYATLYKINPEFFSMPQDQNSTLGMWDFTYFSVTTITTIGLSDVKPNSHLFWPQACVSVELIVGIFWIVIYFAVAMTLLQAYVRDLLNRLAQARSQ